MKRAVITGLGVVSCIGNNKEEVLASLQEGKSGIRRSESFAEKGMKSQVSGVIDIDFSEHIDRKAIRFMGDAAAYSYIAMKEAIADSGLTDEQVSHDRTGVIAGSGGGSPHYQVAACDTVREKNVKRVGAFAVPKTMSSTVSANLATAFKIRGLNYSIASACATGTHCIGAALEQIQLGKQDVIFAGGGEEIAWELASLFDAMGALTSKYNDTPETASRPFDVSRDGFIYSGGAGMVVVEEYEHAVARGATIYAEIVGYGANSDGADMVAPSGEGAVRCMNMALSTTQGDVDYINAHGTSTPVGDVKELGAIKAVFGDKAPAISSTKSMTGHSLGATGVQEVIFTLLMMKHNFIAPTINVVDPDAATEGLDIVANTKRDANIKRAMSNSFGFGGTNASLVFEKLD